MYIHEPDTDSANDQIVPSKEIPSKHWIHEQQSIHKLGPFHCKLGCDGASERVTQNDDSAIWVFDLEPQLSRPPKKCGPGAQTHPAHIST